MEFHSIDHSFDTALGITIWRTSIGPDRVGDFVVLPDAKADVLIQIDSRSAELRQLSYTGFDLRANRVDLPAHSIFLGIQFDASTCLAAQEIMVSDRLESAVIQSAIRSALADEPFASPGLGELAMARRDDLVQIVIRHLEENPHRDQIALASSLTGVSIRTIERRFVRSTGRTPTDFVRIYRFLQLKRLVGFDGPGATSALQAGYADQAHMCREVKRMSTMTPRELASHLLSKAV